MEGLTGEGTEREGKGNPGLGSQDQLPARAGGTPGEELPLLLLLVETGPL